MRTENRRPAKSRGKGRAARTAAADGVARAPSRQRIVSMNLRRANKRKPRAPGPAKQNARELALRALERRAIEAVSWGMPAVNFDLMLQAMQRVAGIPGSNKVVYWSRPFTWKNQTLTPNPDTIYFMPFFDTKKVGPVVLEIPPAEGGSLVGSVDDAWQTALEDVGPAGADQGKGGKYLILPPGHADPVPDGYIVLRSPTWQSYALLRSSLRSTTAADVDAAVAYAKAVRVHPLGQADHPPDTVFVDAIDHLFDATIPRDLRFFESLDRVVQYEPWIERDRAMIDVLRNIGIEKGKTFAPDPATRKILERALHEALAWMDSIYDDFFPPYAEGARWALPASAELMAGLQNSFANTDSYPTDARGRTYSVAYFSAKHLGAGQFYLMTIKDKNGKSFDGAHDYRLTVPANAPVKLYWSATAYARSTHALICNTPWCSRSSLSDGIQKNTDGSTTLYFSAKTPPGREANWVPTDARGEFEVLFRLYGPEKSFFDKQWVLPDIERVN
jgi:hypothetical protein